MIVLRKLFTRNIIEQKKHTLSITNVSFINQISLKQNII